MTESKQPSNAHQAAPGGLAVQGHTPGPWNWYDDTDAAGKNNRHEIVALGKTICHIYTSVPHEDSANARLIAAAPDLLKAAKRALATLRASGYHDEPNNVLGALYAAIARATGN